MRRLLNAVRKGGEHDCGRASAQAVQLRKVREVQPAPQGLHGSLHALKRGGRRTRRCCRASPPQRSAGAGVARIGAMAEIGTMRVKSGLAEMLKGGVIMDVTDAEQARIAED